VFQHREKIAQLPIAFDSGTTETPTFRSRPRVSFGRALDPCKGMEREFVCRKAAEPSVPHRRHKTGRVKAGGKSSSRSPLIDPKRAFL
jgi:hypothetical protein